MLTHGQTKYPQSTVLLSSEDRGWAAICAEIRRHGESEGPGYAGRDIEVAILMEGDIEGSVSCRFGGACAPIPTTRGTAWICPANVEADEIRIAAPSLVTSAHFYLPRERLASSVFDDSIVMPASPEIRSDAVREDPMITQLGRAIIDEMSRETSGGRLLVEAASNMMLAWLLTRYSELSPATLSALRGSRLDDRRLKRVIAYIEDHLDEDLSLSALAEIACLSEFHFNRMFASAVGTPPHRYVSQRRLERAKGLIESGRLPLAEIAKRSRFSSQTSFTRAFRKATGMSPGEYRQHLK